MLRVLFFQDTYLSDYNTARREGQEIDLQFEDGCELYREGKVDILNPYNNEDLLENIDEYEKDWERFINIESYRP